jgi:hypothetical protein
MAKQCRADRIAAPNSAESPFAAMDRHRRPTPTPNQPRAPYPETRRRIPGQVAAAAYCCSVETADRRAMLSRRSKGVTCIVNLPLRSTRTHEPRKVSKSDTGITITRCSTQVDCFPLPRPPTPLRLLSPLFKLPKGCEPVLQELEVGLVRNRSLGLGIQIHRR